MHKQAWILALSAAVLLSGCSVKRMGLQRMADAVSATATAYARDNDPEFVRTGAPATLKMVEMLLDQDPHHAGLLLTACSGFTQYAYAFIQVDSELLADGSGLEARNLRGRASRMYDRARDYCLRGLDVTIPGARAALLAGRMDWLGPAEPTDVPLLYWTAAAWGGSIGVARNSLLRLGEATRIRSLLERAIALDPSWQSGALHELMIGVEGLPELAGGSAARARAHFDTAVKLSEGQSAFAYVTMATSVAQPAKDRAEFERLLKAALAVDVDKRPEIRLANLIAQKRARFLLSTVEQLF